MLKLSSLLIIITIVSCGKKPIPHHIDPYFNQFINRFNADTKAHGLTTGDFNRITVIEFGLSNNTEVGICSYIKQSQDNSILFNYSDFHKEIKFNDSFKQLDYDNQYKVFLHEVGHCAYHMSHNQNIDTIMYPIAIQTNQLNVQEESYFDDVRSNSAHWFDTSNVD